MYKKSFLWSSLLFKYLSWPFFPNPYLLYWWKVISKQEDNLNEVIRISWKYFPVQLVSWQWTLTYYVLGKHSQYIVTFTIYGFINIVELLKIISIYNMLTCHKSISIGHKNTSWPNMHQSQLFYFQYITSW